MLLTSTNLGPNPRNSCFLDQDFRSAAIIFFDSGLSGLGDFFGYIVIINMNHPLREWYFDTGLFEGSVEGGIELVNRPAGLNKMFNPAAYPK